MIQGRDYIGVSCVFYCHDGKGNLLLHKRSNSCRDEQNKWDCGGGAMELGETFIEAVTREVREEYNAHIVKLVFAGANNVIRKVDSEKTHWIALIFSVHVDRKTVSIGCPEKMTELGWFTLDALPSPLHSFFLENLEFIKKLPKP